MPIIRTSASDVTMFRRVNATNLPLVAPNLRRPGSYVAPLRNLIPPIARASVAGKGASPSNSVLGVPTTPPTPPPGDPITGSILFTPQLDVSDIVVGDFLVIGQDETAPLEFGTGDFTIEWTQYFTGTAPQATPFSFDILLLGLTIEPVPEPGTGHALYLWIDGVEPPAIGIDESGNGLNILNTWVTIAIVRSGATIKVFFNGNLIGTMTSDFNIGSENPLVIGAQSNNPVPNELFEGNITNFRWVVGHALYSSNYVPSTDNLPNVSGTALLLHAKTEDTFLVDSSNTSGIVVSNVGAEWSSNVPS
jgi:hypothetical protein